MSQPQMQQEIQIQSGEDVTLPGILTLPSEASGTVLFAHGSGSGRFSPRNNAVAQVLNDANLATLLVDLLTDQEAQDRRLVFDIALLSKRLLSCSDFLREAGETASLSIGYFGASTGAAAGLVAAAELGETIKAVVSRGGRPDLAGSSLRDVKAPTLLIVGGNDEPVIGLNEGAYQELQVAKELVIVPGATHLFEEPGALEEVSKLARDWFLKYLWVMSRES